MTLDMTSTAICEVPGCGNRQVIDARGMFEMIYKTGREGWLCAVSPSKFEKDYDICPSCGLDGAEKIAREEALHCKYCDAEALCVLSISDPQPPAVKRDKYDERKILVRVVECEACGEEYSDSFEIETNNYKGE